MERIITEAEGLRVGAAWMLEHRVALAEFGVGEFSICLYGGCEESTLKFFLYGDDDAKRENCDRLRELLPDMPWAHASLETSIGIEAEIVSGMSVMFFGTRQDR